MAEQDGGVEGDHHVLGRQVAAAVLAAGGKQDDHLDQLRQGVVHARGHRPLHNSTSKGSVSNQSVALTWEGKRGSGSGK